MELIQDAMAHKKFLDPWTHEGTELAWIHMHESMKLNSQFAPEDVGFPKRKGSSSNQIPRDPWDWYIYLHGWLILMVLLVFM